MTNLKNRTPLLDWHVAHGASVVDFKGWEMPLWYPSGAVAEHRIVLTNAGIFDTGHMSAVIVTGHDAGDLLKLCFSRDLSAAVAAESSADSPRSGIYGVFLNERGELVDDAIIYTFDPETFLVSVNAGMGAPLSEHLVSHREGRDATVTDVTGQVCKVDVQGPLAGKVLVKVLKDPQKALKHMGYFMFRGRYKPDGFSSEIELVDGTPVLLARTGYTGEFGFEIFIPAHRLPAAWELFLREGAPFGLIPCGLAARDSLRAGAVFPLARQDIGPWPFVHHPWSFALPYNQDGTGFTKRFIGDEALLTATDAAYTHAYVGADPRKVSPHDPAVVLDPSGHEIGLVTTCVADMAIGRYGGRIYSLASPDKPADFKPTGLICGFVRAATKLQPGQTVQLKDKRRTVNVTIVDDIRPDRTARRSIEEML